MKHYITLDKARLAKKHYENFPVATLLFPKKFRDAATILYYFARTGDDIADEGNFSTYQRLNYLNTYQDSLNQLKKNNNNVSPLFLDINKISKKFKIKISVFERLIKAFKQDVTKKRYKNFKSLEDYFNNAAAPAGEMILTLFNKNSKKNLNYSNSLCTGLALVGITQDFHEDIKKQRLYIPLNEMKKFNLKTSDIQKKKNNNNWQVFKVFWLNRIETFINEGTPLINNLDGRLRLQIKILIKASQILILRMRKDNYNLFNNPPRLSKIDWLLIFCRCILIK